MAQRQIKVPKVLWDRAKERQKQLKKKGINRTLWECVALETQDQDKILGGLRL